MDGDSEFKQQQSKQADAAKDHGAASLASEKEKLQKVWPALPLGTKMGLQYLQSSSVSLLAG